MFRASSISPDLTSRVAAAPGPVTVQVSTGFSPVPAFFWKVSVSAPRVSTICWAENVRRSKTSFLRYSAAPFCRSVANAPSIVKTIDRARSRANALPSALVPMASVALAEPAFTTTVAAGASRPYFCKALTSVVSMPDIIVVESRVSSPSIAP